MNEEKNILLRDLPRVDELLLELKRGEAGERVSREVAKEIARKVINDLRLKILETSPDSLASLRPALDLTAALKRAREMIGEIKTCSLRPLVNATGIIIHTNLGRAPLAAAALKRVLEVGKGYCNLEYDLAEGRRGDRSSHVSHLFRLLTGAEDALVVNNNAAAVFLVLNALAEGREVLVSRGELIEIGGEFRLPDIMAKSGARLREVGTTNRTRISDYEKAVTAETALILKVHPSNYRIVGFTEEAPLAQLVALGKRLEVPVMNDVGSGCLVDLAPFGLKKEPLISEVLADGADVVTFSGDKLLGGPQAGVILGKYKILAEIKKNPLNRILRIDKLTMAALEGTLMHYLEADGRSVSLIPVLKSLALSEEEVKNRGQRLYRRLKRVLPATFTLGIREGASLAGGGALPLEEIPTTLLSLRAEDLPAELLEERLRREGIIVRIAEDEVLFDLRTVEEDELGLIADALEVVGRGEGDAGGRKD